MAARQENNVADAETVNLPGFVDLSCDLEDHFITAKDSRHTRAVVATSVNVLSDYCSKSANTTLAAVEQMTPTELCQFLREFYSAVRQKDGSFYARRSMLTLRYGLQRHFLKVRAVDIANDFVFIAANNVFNAVLTNLKSSVKMSHVRKKNMAKIRASSATDCSTPRGLQNTVFIDLMLHLCCSTYGRRNLREMKKSHFLVMTDPSSNRRYVCFANKDTMGGVDFLSGDGNNESDEGDGDLYSGNRSRMYETPDKPESCPVLCFEKYMAKLNPKSDDFWQRPKKVFTFSPNDRCWFDAVSLGKNTLGNKMREISAEAGCSITYSNQCLKVTGKLMNHIGCKEKCGNYCYAETMTSSSDEDGSSSEYDDQTQESYPQVNATRVMLGENRDKGRDGGSGISVKLEGDSGEVLTDYHQPLSNACDGPAPNGVQQSVSAPITSSTGYTVQNPSPMYPIRISVNPNYGTAPSEHDSEQHSQQNLNGIDQDAWTVERSWLDEKNRRKWILTKKNVSSTAVQDAWRQRVELQTQRNATPTNQSFQNQPPSQKDALTNLPKQNVGNPSLSLSRSASEILSDPHTHRQYSSNAPTSGSHGALDTLAQTGGSGGIRTEATTSDDQLLQLQKKVLMMQQENLALERRKIEMEMAKLEAERLKLEAERRKLTIEGDKLQRDML